LRDPPRKHETASLPIAVALECRRACHTRAMMRGREGGFLGAIA
jgi:hypothetical protein